VVGVGLKALAKKEDVMSLLRCTVLAVLAVALCSAPVAIAHGPHKHGGAVAAPVHRVAGFSGGELWGELWVQDLSHPGTFSGSCIPLGHKGKVLAPIPGEDFTASCTVKPGTPLFFAFGSECSDVEEPPFFGADEEAQRACAITFDEFFVAASITVDHGKTVEMLNPRFEVISPQQTVELPADNIFGIPPQTATLVAHGWAALVRGLPPGEHTITVEVTTTDEEATFTATINVVPRGHSHD
jgi:hypothetical protein